MSFDLGVWSAGVRPSRAEAVDTYVRLCEGDAQAVRPAAQVAAFHAALVAEFPEPAAGSDAAVDESAPWSAGLDVGPGHVVMPMPWGRAADVAPRVLELAARHGLVCFDPQAGVVHLPPALRSPGALELRSCAGLPVADADPETVRRAIDGLLVGQLVRPARGGARPVPPGRDRREGGRRRRRLRGRVPRRLPRGALPVCGARPRPSGVPFRRVPPGSRGAAGGRVVAQHVAVSATPARGPGSARRV